MPVTGSKPKLKCQLPFAAIKDYLTVGSRNKATYYRRK